MAETERAMSGAGAGVVPSKGLIPTRPLGRTGEQVTIYGLGGLFTLARVDQHEQAIQIIHRALDLGVNYIDTSALYGAGASELHLGAVLKDRRSEVFLGSKSHDYTYDGTMAMFEQSLRRLQTDHLDLYQHHYLGQLGSLEQLRQPRSARQALERLRDQGVIRFVGVTGHSSRLLADALEDYPYDCALITLNAARRVMDDAAHLARFFSIAQQRQVGVIAMKVVERGTLVQQGLPMDRLLPYVLSHPVSTAIVGITELAHLVQNVRIARAFAPLSAAQMSAFEALAQDATA